MNLISKALMVVGLLITVASNVATYYGVRTAVYGTHDSTAEGLASIAWALSSAYSFSLISLVGCFLVLVGLALSMLRRVPRP
ncbi:MAG: hypothetical protein ABW250_07520 [Pyrinomonadaceae bacterium]